MRYQFINEFEAHASADDVWAFYSSPRYPKQVVQLLPTILQTKEILEGDGHSVGTVLRVVYLPGFVPHTYNEQIVTVDHERRLKEVEQIEGGYLDMGFTYCMVSHEIIAKGCNSCIIKSVVHGEIHDEAANGSILHNTLDGYVALARAVSKRISEHVAAVDKN